MSRISIPSLLLLVASLPVACFEPGGGGGADEADASTSDSGVDGSASTPTTTVSGATASESDSGDDTASGDPDTTPTGDDTRGETDSGDPTESGDATDTGEPTESGDPTTGDDTTASSSSGSSSSGEDLACGDSPLGEDGTCTVTLVAIEDAQVVSLDFADDNFGDGEITPYAVGQQNDFTGNQIGRAFLKFDTSSLPAGAVVHSGTLQVKEYDNFAGFPMTLAVRPAATNWDEDTVTWNTQPLVTLVELDTTDVGCCGEAHELDVTLSAVAAVQNGFSELAFMLFSADEGTIGGVRWFMREGEGVEYNGITGVAPQLVVNFTPP